MEYLLLIAAVAAGILGGPVYGQWKINRIIQREKAETLNSLQAGCTRREDLAERYSGPKPPMKCQCAAILGITAQKGDCPKQT